MKSDLCVEILKLTKNQCDFLDHQFIFKGGGGPRLICIWKI